LVEYPSRFENTVTGKPHPLHICAPRNHEAFAKEGCGEKQKGRREAGLFKTEVRAVGRSTRTQYFAMTGPPQR
jgi:hypothetical protein